jgi:CO/xanthine dehydrogenase Mo-binding subunit
MQDGYVLTTQLKDMGIPRTTDVPTDIRPFIIEENHPYGPFGAKGMGEIPLNATAPGILNAIYDAVGVRVTSTPITPDRLLKLMREKNGVAEGAE